MLNSTKSTTTQSQSATSKKETTKRVNDFELVPSQPAKIIKAIAQGFYSGTSLFVFDS